MSRKREKEPYFTSVYTTPQSQTGPGKEHYYSSIHSREQQAPPPYYTSQSQAYVNPSYTPPSSFERGGRYHVGSRPAPADRAPANRQRCCLIVTVVTLVIIIVGAGIGLGVYFGGNIIERTKYFVTQTLEYGDGQTPIKFHMKTENAKSVTF